MSPWRSLPLLATATSAILASCVATNGTGDGSSSSLALEVDRPTLDFGAVDCGGSADAKEIQIANRGASAVAYVATVEPADVFLIEGASTGTLAPASTGPLRIRVATVPSTAVAGAALEATLTLTSDLADAAPLTVPLRLTPTGGALEISPAAVSFGQVLRGVAATSQPVTIKNVGTKALSLALSAPKDGSFGFTWAGAPAAIPLAPGNSIEGAVASFTPSADGVVAEDLPITVTGPLCASAAPQVSLGGEGVPSPVIISDVPLLDFGTTPCRTTKAAKTVSITNANTFAIDFSTTLTGRTDLYTVTPASGSVPANSKVSLTVTPKAMVGLTGAITAATVVEAVLKIETTAPGAPGGTITLRQKPDGSMLTVSKATVDFGAVDSGDTKASDALGIGSPGIANASYRASSGFSVTSSLADITAGTGCTGEFAASATPANPTARACVLSYLPKTKAGATGATLTITAANACNADLKVALNGTGQFPQLSTALVGNPGPTALPVDAFCGKAAPSIGITTTNNGTATLKVRSTSGAPASPYTTNITTAFSIAKGASGTLSVGGNVAGPAERGGDANAPVSFSFTTNELNWPTYNLTLTRTVHGANLFYALPAASNTPIASYAVPGVADGASCPGPQSFFLRNSGNEDVTVTAPWSVSDPRVLGLSGAGVVPKSGALEARIDHNAFAGPGTTATETIVHTPAAGSSVCTGPGTLPVTYTYAGACTVP